MTDEAAPTTSSPGTRVLSVRWDSADVERFAEAAKTLSDREHFDVTVTDIIRRGARREADAILAEQAA